MRSFNKLFLICTLLSATKTYADSYIDWRKTGSNQEKQKNLVKTIPGTSVHMRQVSEQLPKPKMGRETGEMTIC